MAGRKLKRWISAKNDDVIYEHIENTLNSHLPSFELMKIKNEFEGGCDKRSQPQNFSDSQHLSSGNLRLWE